MAFKNFRIETDADLTRMKAVTELADGRLQHPRRLILKNQNFPNAAQQHHPPNRRLPGRDQQPVIPAPVAPDHAGRRKPAQAVGQTPFPIQCRVKLPGGLYREERHS